MPVKEELGVLSVPLGHPPSSSRTAKKTLNLSYSSEDGEQD